MSNMATLNNISVKHDNTDNLLNISIRPYALDFLHKIACFYKLVVCTAAHITYAQEIVALLNEKQRIIDP